MKKLVLIFIFICGFVSISAKSDPSKNINNGDSAFMSKDYEKAINYFTKAINDDNDSFIAYYKRGLAYLYINQFNLSADDFTRALELDSTSADSYNNRGLAYSYLGDLASAVKDFDKALKIDPKFAQALINRGSAFISQNNYEKALKDFNSVLKIDKKNPELYLQRARLYYSKEKFAESIKDYSMAIALGMNNAKIFYNRANAYFKNRQLKEAIDDYSKSHELDPKDLDALNNRAYAYKELGLDTLAESDHQKISDMKKNFYTPISELKMKVFTNSGKDFFIDLPQEWNLQESINEPDHIEFIISPDLTNPSADAMQVGVSIGIIKNMSLKYNVKSESDILDFWKGSLDKSNEDLQIYKVIWQKHQQWNSHASILNESTMQASEKYVPFMLYEYCLAYGDNMIFVYFQAPQVHFEYFSKIFDIALKSIKLGDNFKMEIK
jgi:tetratricopeptide (TPR) repeat protein